MSKPAPADVAQVAIARFADAIRLDPSLQQYVTRPGEGHGYECGINLITGALWLGARHHYDRAEGESLGAWLDRAQTAAVAAGRET